MEKIAIGKFHSRLWEPYYASLPPKYRVVPVIPGEADSLLAAGLLVASPVSPVAAVMRKSLRPLDLGVSLRPPGGHWVLLSRVPVDEINRISDRGHYPWLSALMAVLLGRKVELVSGAPGDAEAHMAVAEEAEFLTSGGGWPHRWDLVALWAERTGLPLVLGVWAAREGAPGELEGDLFASLRASRVAEAGPVGYRLGDQERLAVRKMAELLGL